MGIIMGMGIGMGIIMGMLECCCGIEEYAWSAGTGAVFMKLSFCLYS